MKTRSPVEKLWAGRRHNAPHVDSRNGPAGGSSKSQTPNPKEAPITKFQMGYCGNGSISSPPTKPVLPVEEREKGLGTAADELQWSKAHSANADGGARQRGCLLLLSEDEVFCWKLLVAASQVGRRLVRGHSTADGPQMLRIVKPEVVLLDLDLHEELAWIAADALLQEENCPPLILLTSNGRQSDFDTAIQAGCLIEKTIEPMRLLAVVEQKLMSTKADQREQNVLQRLVIRWLKPCSWSTQVIPQNRYWGINE